MYVLRYQKRATGFFCAVKEIGIFSGIIRMASGTISFFVALFMAPKFFLLKCYKSQLPEAYTWKSACCPCILFCLPVHCKYHFVLQVKIGYALYLFITSSPTKKTERCSCSSAILCNFLQARSLPRLTKTGFLAVSTQRSSHQSPCIYDISGPDDMQEAKPTDKAITRYCEMMVC